MELLRIISRTMAVLLTLCYSYQVAYLFVPFFIRRKPHGKITMHRYAVLIAARNEETVLPYLLDSINAQDYPRELVDTYVVADNCTDRTAELAAEKGATVFRRFSTTKVGKGYALNFLLKKMTEAGRIEEYDAFLVFDADNLLSPNYITEINKTYSDGFEAFCGYRNSKNLADNWVSAGYGMWYLHDSIHLNQSRMLLGTTCAVSGTGFGFTRRTLEKCGGWNFFTLTEDIEFDTWCATNGVRIGYCPDAMLFDEQPVSFVQSWRQRTRWVQGGIQVSLRYAGQLFKGILKGGKTGYASFEMSTLLLWGYGMSVVVAVLSMVTMLLARDWPHILESLPVSLITMYLSMLLVGVLTTYSAWNQIRATAWQKIGYTLTFPFFMITFVPIAICSVFKKFNWTPISHTVAVPVSKMISEK